MIQPPRLTLLPVVSPQETHARLSQEAILDLARRLRGSGWQVNVAFESGDDGDRFTLSGAHVP